MSFKTRLLIVGLFFLTLIFFPSLEGLSQEYHWVKAGEKAGVMIYTSDVTGSSFKAFRGEVVVHSTLSAIVSLIIDVDHFCVWNKRTANARLLAGTPTDHYLYVETPAPWPVQNRDAITHAQLNQNLNSLEVCILLKGVPDYIPLQSGFLRIPYMEGMWLLTPQEAGFVKITYQVHADPGGEIPAWLSNQAVTDTPLATLTNLRNEIKRSPYAHAKLNYIKEP